MSLVNYETIGEVAVLTVDNPPVNVLSHGVRTGLYEGVLKAKGDSAIKAVVILCAGRTFIAGADITEFGAPRQHPRLRDIQRAIEAGDKPVVAALHGTALGGGFELAIACHFRIARKDAKVGLPEVNIGVIPGGGGTQLLPRLVGPEVAMEMDTSGKHFDTAFGLEQGLIDEVTDGDLRAAAIAFAGKIVAEGRPLRVTARDDSKVRGIDPQVFADFRKKIEKKAKGQMAPWKIIDAIEVACRTPFEEGDKFEIEAFEACNASPQKAALTHLFKAEREARRIPGLEGVEPLTIRKAAVVGSGTMGGGIAMNFANVGIPVVMLDVSDEVVAKGMAKVVQNYATSVERGSTTQAQMDAAVGRITTGSDYKLVADADIVVEAAFEDMALKKEIYAKLDALAPAHAILASNTSSLDIDEIASATSRPDKVVGTHFFSPANVMKLLENVRGAKSSPQTLATVMTVARTIDKVPVLAGNCNGFIGNRMFQFWNNGWEYLLEEGATPEQVDRVVLDFGMAMGPVAVRDLAGLDVAAMVRAARAPLLPKEERISPIIEQLVALGRKGQKTGAGFYRYEGRKALPDPAVTDVIVAVAREAGVTRRTVGDDEIIPRMLAPLINEGAKILEEGIALRAGDIDVTFCHGYGFPKHLGGPMYWAEQHGLAKIVAIMEDLAPRFGPRYRPAGLLKDLAASGKGWAAAGVKAKEPT
jgi:3-hydroxyacyl-CoA dehydrogenase